MGSEAQGPTYEKSTAQHQINGVLAERAEQSRLVTRRQRNPAPSVARGARLVSSTTWQHGNTAVRQHEGTKCGPSQAFCTQAFGWAGMSILASGHQRIMDAAQMGLS